MQSHSLPAAIAAARNYDFSGIARILDVGGGSGCFMTAVAQVDTKAVDMFREPWPKGYDAVFFSNIWHDWNFRTCAWLAVKAYEALPRGGRIMLHEALLDDQLS